MTQENDSESGDLEQIVADQRSSLKLLEQMLRRKPELADDLTEIYEKTQKNLDGLEEIAKSEQEKKR